MDYFSKKKLISYIVVLSILLLSIGYSSFSSNLSIRDMYAQVRLEKDVMITNVSVAPETQGTTEETINSVCDLVSDIGDIGISYGDKYICDPGDGVERTFYVLEDGDNTTLIKGDTGTTEVGELTLIMNENIGSNTHWGNMFDEAPTIALPYLQSQTTGWTNVEVNMPTYEQIYSVNNSEDLTSTPWLYENLDFYYWTTKYANSEPIGDTGYSVREGLLGVYGSSSANVRPVITLNKNQINSSNQEIVIQNNGGSSTYIDYNVSNIQAGINLPNVNSSITFNAVVTNISAVEMAIKEIIGLPDNLDYEILNYNLKEKICNENNECKLGIQKEIQIRIKYKEGYYDNNNTQYNIVLNFDFQPVYTIKYIDIAGEGYPTEILAQDTLTVDFKENAPDKILIKINNIEITNYTYQNGVLVIPNVIGDIKVELNLDESICKLIKDNGEEGITPGDEYLCKVDPNKEPYTFYVLSDGENGTTNLIMDSNINKSGVAIKSNDITDKGLVKWNESGINTNGPVTAMDYLENATSTWTNLTKMTINTFDDDEEATHNMGKTYNVYARMPYKSEVKNYKSDGTNRYLYDYLKSFNNIQLNPIEGIYGYWTSSASSGSSYYAWYVDFSGCVENYGRVSREDSSGVRPVINLKL